MMIAKTTKTMAWPTVFMPGCSHRGSSSEESGGWYAKYLCSTDVIIWFQYWSTESFDFSSRRQITKHIDTHCIFVVRSSKDSSRLVWLFSSQLNSSIFVISLCFSTWLPSRSVKDRCKDDFQTGWPTCSMQAMSLDRAPQLSFIPLWEEQTYPKLSIIPQNYRSMLNKSKGCNCSLYTTAFPSFCTDSLRWWLSSWKASAPYKTETFYHQLGYCPTSYLIFTECVYSAASDGWHPHFLIPIFDHIY